MQSFSIFLFYFLCILYTNQPGHDPCRTWLYILYCVLYYIDFILDKASVLYNMFGYWGFIISHFYKIVWYPTWRFIMHIFEILYKINVMIK